MCVLYCQGANCVLKRCNVLNHTYIFQGQPHRPARIRSQRCIQCTNNALELARSSVRRRQAQRRQPGQRDGRHRQASVGGVHRRRGLARDAAVQVRKTPSWPRSWAKAPNFSLLNYKQLHSHRNLASMHHRQASVRFGANLTTFSLSARWVRPLLAPGGWMPSALSWCAWFKSSRPARRRRRATPRCWRPGSGRKR